MSHSILETIGNTPLVEIKKLNKNSNVKIFAKLEYFNPGGSIKDRPALSMIESGEKSGELTHNKTVIEATSGNTGIGLALVCSVKGYKLMLTMSESASLERQKILKARGAQIILTPGHLGTDGAIEEVYRLARENPDKYFMADQYNNKANWKAHYYGTANEIIKQTNGEITTLVAAMGTTGTLMGLSRRLKEHNPDIQIIGVEPYLGHKIQGLKNMKEAYCPELYNKKLLDKKINIDDDIAFDMTRKLSLEEGLFVGMSSGAAMAIALKEAEKMKKGTIVVIFPDNGERYLSTSLFTVKEKTGLKLFNTLTKTKEFFTPLQAGKVSMYSCGPTLHAKMHLGGCRRFVFADLVSRYLEYKLLDVKHIINITDLDDKTIQKAEQENLNLDNFSEKYLKFFKEDLDFLSIKPATKYPRVSEHVSDMVDLTEKLVNKGFAYEKLKSLYFNITHFSDYGKLSKIDIDKIRLGATVDLDEYEKDNPRDFTLLKRSKLSELKKGIYIKTRWGNIRPSLHIQCAAISMKHLGESFDIHTSSTELIFPHHENEIAIAGAATGKPLAKYWLHCDSVLIQGKKINETQTRITLEDLKAKGYSGRQIRFFILSAHYRKSLKFSFELLENAKRSLSKLDTSIQALLNVKKGSEYKDLDQLLYDIKQGFINAMDDDLNISKALASIFTNIKKINILIQDKKIDPTGASKIIEVLKDINSVLNIFDFEDKLSNSKVKNLIDQRNKARSEKNWILADKLRQEIIALGVTVRDKKI